MYAHNTVLGFHGCKKSIRDSVISGKTVLLPSKNTYDWLGSGTYFWEDSVARALDWATERYGAEASVLGAAIDLDYCFNLTDFENAETLLNGYKSLKENFADDHIPMPKNLNVKTNEDWLLRELDCAVVNQVHFDNELLGNEPFDSVRGIFTEGRPVYPGAGFRGKTHVQLCIRNPKCIKGYFVPLV